MNKIHIELVNWEKHLHRKDLKSLSWFRVNSDIMFHPKMHKICPKCAWMYICLLGLCAKKMSSALRLNIDYLSDISGCDSAKCLKELEKRELVRIRTDSYGFVPNITEHNKTKENNNYCSERDASGHIERAVKKTQTKNNAVTQAELERAYDFYPRKIGKGKGIKKLLKEIKSPDDLKSLEEAIKNYASYVAKQNTEEKYIKHFSTFANEWRDWIELEKSFSSTEAHVNRLMEDARRELENGNT